MSSTPKGRLPSKPLSYKHKDLCTKEEIMVDYITGRIYVRLTNGDVVDITGIVLEDIRNCRTIDDYIYVHVPESDELVTIKAAYADTISKINGVLQAIRDLQDPEIEDSLYAILTRNYISADDELFNTLTNNYKNADSILKSYVNKLFEKLGLKYNEEDDTYTIGIANAYIIHEGVSEIYNLTITVAPPGNIDGITLKSTDSFYVYSIPVNTQRGYLITLDSNKDKIISKNLDFSDINTSAPNVINQIENKHVQISEYQSIAYTTIIDGAILIFADYPITSKLNITFAISRN